ncbi:hypothetical protein [Pseudomonas gingeri]|uniref:Uncharacterized protein n=1 Tax=Pseudomonas gingeri TaxID=117681 RepID=A0A7Y8CK01_9PSED|nr:hypothetical protein [Pseudomonas gingeri]NWB31558.1 hypothetical protein [Pseudomonas gingeri]NWC33050.1 hypothetical protein [Pseudomonas gingeri]
MSTCKDLERKELRELRQKSDRTAAQQPRTLLAEPVGANLLPEVAGDDQGKILGRNAAATGLELEIEQWPDETADPTDFNILKIFVDNNEIRDLEVHYPQGGVPSPVELAVPILYLGAHGLKEVRYEVSTDWDRNPRDSATLTFFYDTRDPNLGNQPEAVRLDADLIANNKQVTPEYLSSHNDEVVMEVDDPVDRRPGDTYAFYWGSGLSTPTLHGILPPGPIQFHMPASRISAMGQGPKILQYTFTDRAGNRSPYSTPDTVYVLLSDPPGGLLAPDVPAAPIDREEARMGVLVNVLAYDNPQGGDEILLYWHGTYVDTRRVPAIPAFPIAFTVDYDVIASHGTLLPYVANVEYFVRRGSDIGSLVNPVTVNLVVPGDPLDPDNPGPEDPLLPLPELESFTQEINKIVPIDSGENATIRIELPNNLVQGDLIEIFYGPGNGEFVADYPVTGLEGPGFIIVRTLPWSPIIRDVGNGKIPLWYRITDANNYKVSKKQTVDVSVNNFTITDPATFTRVDPADGRIRCAQSPWLGIPVRIFAPTSLAPDDEVELHASGFDFAFNTELSGPPPQIIPHKVIQNDVTQGISLTLDWRYFVLSDYRCGIEIFWTIKKAIGGGGGSSPTTRVQVTVNQAGATCDPTQP